MTAYTNEEWVKLQEVLQQIAMTAENNLQVAEQSYHAVRATMQRIKEFILDYQFKDQQEEILFFKEIKPRFLKELVFYMEVFHTEAGKPIGNKEAQAAYYNVATERVNVFFERNHMLYIYYRMNKSNTDTVYFVRGAGNDPLQSEYTLDIDSRFCTVNSFKFGQIQAYEQLNDYLQGAIYLLEHPDAGLAADEKKKHRNFWTETKAALIELAYAIHSRGAVNHGKGDVKQLVADLEIFFNVQVGNFYRTFQGMRIRKKSRTPFLDILKDSLERRMDDTDLNYTNYPQH